MTAFPTVQKPLHGEIFLQRCVTIIVRRNVSSNASKVCQPALRTILHHDLQFTSGTRSFSSAEHLKTVTIVAYLWPLPQNKTWPRWSVWWRKTHVLQKNEKRYNLNLSLGSLNQILCHHLGVWQPCACWMLQQLMGEQRRGRVEWCLHVLPNLREAGQSRSETSSWVTRRLYTSLTQKPSSSLQSGFSQVRAPFWNWRNQEALPNRWLQSLPDWVMWPLPRFRRERQTRPSGTSTFARPGSSRLGLHIIQTTAPMACCSASTARASTPPPPLLTDWKQIAFCWSPRPRIPWA